MTQLRIVKRFTDITNNERIYDNQLQFRHSNLEKWNNVDVMSEQDAREQDKKESDMLIDAISKKETVKSSLALEAKLSNKQDEYEKLNTGIKIWTDGSCWPNPGPGGWGWHRCDNKQGYGGTKETTNNRMEMTAIFESLVELPDLTKVTVYSDSQYCVKGLTEWRKGWKRKDWMKKNKPMINRDLWIILDPHIERLDISFEWVRGHNGDVMNERADYLAGLGREALNN